MTEQQELEAVIAGLEVQRERRVATRNFWRMPRGMRGGFASSVVFVGHYVSVAVATPIGIG
jgi:hypothetical protein